MARYIDADIVSEEIDKLQDSLASNNDTIWKKNKPIYKGLCNARGIINDTPTADVVPKSEVEQLKRNLEQCENGYRQEMHLLQCKFANAKAELAREIFEEIKEKGRFSEPIVDYICLSFAELAELKKKYTEGEQ